MSALLYQLKASHRLEDEKKLAATVTDALWEYQKFLQDANDDWRTLYRMRIQLANFIDGRKAR